MALKEQDIVFTDKDASGNTIIQMPITRVENVEGAVKTVNGVSPNAYGEVTVNDYLTGLTVSGRTITYTKKDGTTGTIMTQDSTPVTSVNSQTGDVVITDYVTDLSVNGQTVIYTKKDGSTGTIVTQDSTPVTSVNGHTGAITAEQTGCLPLSGGTLTGKVYAPSFQITSDRRLKTELVEIEDALDKVKAIGGHTYYLRGQKDRQAGVIAQDVESVLPEAVVTNPDGYKSVNYSAVVALLVNAVNELHGEVERLKGGRCDGV